MVFLQPPWKCHPPAFTLLSLLLPDNYPVAQRRCSWIHLICTIINTLASSTPHTRSIFPQVCLACPSCFRRRMSFSNWKSRGRDCHSEPAVWIHCSAVTTQIKTYANKSIYRLELELSKMSDFKIWVFVLEEEKTELTVFLAAQCIWKNSDIIFIVA